MKNIIRINYDSGLDEDNKNPNIKEYPVFDDEQIKNYIHMIESCSEYYKSRFDSLQKQKQVLENLNLKVSGSIYYHKILGRCIIIDIYISAKYINPVAKVIAKDNKTHTVAINELIANSEAANLIYGKSDE